MEGACTDWKNGNGFKVRACVMGDVSAAFKGDVVLIVVRLL